MQGVGGGLRAFEQVSCTACIIVGRGTVRGHYCVHVDDRKAQADCRIKIATIHPRSRTRCKHTHSTTCWFHRSRGNIRRRLLRRVSPAPLFFFSQVFISSCLSTLSSDPKPCSPTSSSSPWHPPASRSPTSASRTRSGDSIPSRKQARPSTASGRIPVSGTAHVFFFFFLSLF